MENVSLSVYIEDETSSRQESLLSVSSHNDYIPDVVRVTPKKIGKNNLVGTYTIKVSPETFSSYKIYYYILVPIPSIACVICGAMWWTNLQPWFGYLEGDPKTLQTLLLEFWVLSIIVTFVIIGLVSVALKFSDTYNHEKLKKLFMVITLICITIGIVAGIAMIVVGGKCIHKTKGNKCSTYINLLQNYSNTFDNDNAIKKYQYFIGNKTQGMSASEAQKWINDFFSSSEKKCKNCSKWFIAVYSIFLLFY